jgi:hypothetical protein
MSSSPIARSDDLRHLREEGYDIAVVSNHLVVKGVPYVTGERQVAYGTLVSELSLAGDQTTRPNTHVVFFAGTTPCDQHGQPIPGLVNDPTPRQLAPGVDVSSSFSRKPPGGYPDYYEKMKTYANLLQGPARALDPKVTATTFPPVADEDDSSPFRYLDSATSRARIGSVIDKLSRERIAIVGLGGTGSYVLDLVAKTPVERIDLYDGDVLLTHNAFRAPGATSIEVLRESPNKAAHWAGVYDPLRRGVIAHPHYIDASTVDLLRPATFVFLTMDAGPDKRLVLERLEEWGVAYVDSGMGVTQNDSSLGGIVRTSYWDPRRGESLVAGGRLSFAETDGGEYAQNIQLAELNALAACQAVIRWKKHLGVYLDDEGERSSYFTIDGCHLVTEGGASDTL